MVKPVFGIKNILIFLLYGMSIIAGIALMVAMWFYMLGLNKEGAELFFIFFILVLCSICLPIFLVTVPGLKACSQIVPDWLLCMRAVMDFITFKDLKKLLKNEDFTPIVFPKNVYAVTTEKERKSLTQNLQVSRHWVYVKGVYIPKKMVISIYVQYLYRKGKLPSLHVSTLTESYYSFGHFKIANGAIAAYLREGLEISTLKMLKKDKKTLNEQFYKTVHSKEDFIQFITSE